MKMTLLEMVQDILSSMDSDEVNSIGATTEAQQVATAIKHAFNDIVSRANLPEHFDLFELEPSNDADKPTLMHLPTGVNNLMWVKYDKRDVGDTDPHYLKVQYLPQDVFFDQVFTYRDQSQGDVVRYQIGGINNATIDVVGLNNKHPDYYTSFNDRDIIFDSYLSTMDTTLMKNKTLVYGEFYPTFQMTDDYVPDLDAKQFALLYNEAKASCFADLKQTENSRAERKVRQGWVTLQHQKSAIPARPNFIDTTPNYGRKGNYASRARRGYHRNDY